MIIKKLLILAMFMIFGFIIFAQNNKMNNMKLSTAFCDFIIKNWPNPLSLSEKGWEYNNGIILHGMQKVYKATGSKAYLEYIQKWADNFIGDDGRIRFNNSVYNIDFIQPGVLLLFLYEETGLDKYKTAAQSVRKVFDTYPKNKEGGFWHKESLKNEMWLDGIYMAEPFLIKYGYLFNDLEYCSNESTLQITLLADHAADKKTGLLFHAWDEDKNAGWADKKTGVSSYIWSRAMGWYAMALVDVLEYLPKDHKNYSRLIEILNGIAEGIKKTQDNKTGLWHQVMDHKEKNNWLETSGSCMFIYALKKAVNNGYIDKEYLKVAEKGWKGIKSFAAVDKNGNPSIVQAVEGMGVQSDYLGYIYKAKLTNSSHGLCGILAAASVMEF